MSDRPIADYALLSDCHSSALVSRNGSIDWLCFPRFDSPALFARLLDEDGGHWRIEPRGWTEARRRYRGASLVLETTFETPEGAVSLEDALAVGPNDRGHELGLGAPHALLRRARCTRGRVELDVSYAPRPEFGLVHPLLDPQEGGLFARGGASVLALSTPIALELAGGTARAELTLREGEEASFALQHRASWQASPELWSETEIALRIEETYQAWQSWSKLHQNYEGPWEQEVLHSGRVLQGLTYAPTGAIVAAATTSLPESVGGGRNWDYRYAWVRDASLTMEALWVAACPDEAGRFFEYLVHAAASDLERGADLQIMFGVGGERDLTERELPHLSGWRRSRPVRVGNDAWSQRQLDVYGEMLAAAHRLRDQLTELPASARAFLRKAADVAAERWTEKDRGIWEVRGPEQHYVHSKLMCWVAVDRAIEMSDLLEAKDEVERWTEAREAIRNAVETRGFSDDAGAFVQSFESVDLDASNLLVPIVGFLPADDPRVLATVKATRERLTDERGLVYRYRGEDGLSGEEGTFLLCTFWLAHALALAGEIEAARDVFETACGYANDVGLLSEEVDPRTGELLGNFPQAFSHIGLVNAAWAISQSASPEQPPRSRGSA